VTRIILFIIFYACRGGAGALSKLINLYAHTHTRCPVVYNHLQPAACRCRCLLMRFARGKFVFCRTCLLPITRAIYTLHVRCSARARALTASGRARLAQA
jgi:hypothetical protein